MWLSKGEFLLYDDSLLGDLERASGWIFETLVPGALVPLSCACCQSRSGRQRWYHISAEHEENCLSGEMTALFFPGGKLTLAHRNANLKTAHTASRNVNYFSCWHSVCNIFLLHDVYSLVSKLPQKCTFFFFFFLPGSSSSSPCAGLQTFGLFKYSCVGSHHKPNVWKNWG